MPVSIRDARHSLQDKAWIQARYPEYLEDLTRANMNTGMFPVSGDFGERQPEMMARWFADDSSHPLLILSDNQPVGFALVSRPPVNLRDRIDFRMSDFFVATSARRTGIGRAAAQLIFSRFAGTWEIHEFLYNKSAVQFWRAIVAEYTSGSYTESVTHGEVRQMFRSGAMRGARQE